MSNQVITATAPASDDTAVNPVGELVRLAEKLLEQGNLPKAMEYLSKAHAQEPENRYIGAMMQRIELLSGQGTAVPRIGQTTAPQHEGQVKSSPAKPASLQATQDKVRRLTLVACKLFELGDIDAAFESLMKAYLIDPASPVVAGCEAKMRPVWEKLHARGVAAYEPKTRPSNDDDRWGAMKIRMGASKTRPVLRKTQTATSAPVTPEGNARVEERKKELERARRERDQTMWRTASQPPRTPGPKAQPVPMKRKPLPRLRNLEKYDSPKIFRWLRGE